MQLTKPEAKVSPHIVLGIPAYNADKTLDTVLLEAKKREVDIVVCDDGSTDKTAEIAERNGCKVIRHLRNRGYGAALRSLFRAAREMRADILITMDADGQHDLDDSDRLIRPILNGKADIVTGSRFAGRQSAGTVPKVRKLGIKVITGLTRTLSGHRITDAQCGFRAYNSKAISELNPGEQGMGASTELLLMARERGLKVQEVPVAAAYPDDRQTSTLNPFFHFTDVMASTVKVKSIQHPLMVYGLPGAILIALSSVFGVWALQIYTEEGRLVTNLTLLSIGFAAIGTVLVIAALLLFVLITVIRERQD